MKKRLIVLNHQPSVPPFMLSALKIAVGLFDEVYYYNETKPTNIDWVPGHDTIRFIICNRTKSIGAFFKASFKLLSKNTLKLFINGIKEKGLSIRFAKVLFSHLLYYYKSESLISPLLDCGIETQCFLFSAWFSSEAYCASQMKKKYPRVVSVSLAHSFEIFVSRDPYVAYNFNLEKLANLDAVFFISKEGLQSYLNNVPDAKRYERKLHVVYMGTFKTDDRLNKEDERRFNICTCSRSIPLKRLDILCQALFLWQDGEISWTHIGSGPEDNKILKLAKEVVNKNPHVTISFLGHVQNTMIKEFYSTMPVDLFVNLSTIEGLPISIMEALSYGIPVIATDVGGTKEIVNDKVGFLLSPDITPSIVCDTLVRYHRLPSETKALFREQSFIHWMNNFDADRNFTILYKKLFKLCSE